MDTDNAFHIMEQSTPDGIYLLKSEQWKHQNDMRNMFKVKNKDTRMRSMASFGVSIVNFKQISHIVLVFSLLTLKK